MEMSDGKHELGLKLRNLDYSCTFGVMRLILVFNLATTKLINVALHSNERCFLLSFNCIMPNKYAWKGVFLHF
jgi:hypothetical protein